MLTLITNENILITMQFNSQQKSKRLFSAHLWYDRQRNKNNKNPGIEWTNWSDNRISVKLAKDLKIVFICFLRWLTIYFVFFSIFFFWWSKINRHNFYEINNIDKQNVNCHCQAHKFHLNENHQRVQWISNHFKHYISLAV